MSAVRLMIQPWFKKFFYTLLACSWVTGLVFFVLNTWVRVAGDFGPEKHPVQFIVLVIHGFSAFVMLMLLGALFSNHVPIAWRSRRLRKVGVALVSFAGTQILTAFLLYYVANEAIREWAMYIHLFTGLLLPFMLYLHIFLGKQRKRTLVQ